MIKLALIDVQTCWKVARETNSFESLTLAGILCGTAHADGAAWQGFDKSPEGHPIRDRRQQIRIEVSSRTTWDTWLLTCRKYTPAKILCT